MTDAPERVAADLRELTAVWPELYAARMLGPRRPHAQQQPDPERDARMAATAREERAERGNRMVGNTVVLGSGPTDAPASLHAIETIGRIIMAALRLEDDLRMHLGDGRADRAVKPVMLGPIPQRADTGRALDVLLSYQPALDPLLNRQVPAALRYLATAVWRTYPEVLAHAAAETRWMLRAARSAVGDPPRRRWMPEARCPHCSQLTLFTCDPRQVEGQSVGDAEIRCMANRRDHPPVCICPAGHRGECELLCDAGGQHRWPEGDWPRLSHILYQAQP